MRLSDDDADLPVAETDRMPVSAVACGTLRDDGPDTAGGVDQDADIELAEGADVMAVAADPVPQPVMPAPFRIAISARSLSLDDSDEQLASLPVTGSEDPPEHLVRVRDADLPAERWHAVTGEHIPIPPPSKRAQALFSASHHQAGSDAAVPLMTHMTNAGVSAPNAPIKLFLEPRP